MSSHNSPVCTRTEQKGCNWTSVSALLAEDRVKLVLEGMNPHSAGSALDRLSLCLHWGDSPACCCLCNTEEGYEPGLEKWFLSPAQNSRHPSIVHIDIYWLSVDRDWIESSGGSRGEDWLSASKEAMEIQHRRFKAHFTPETLYKSVDLNRITMPATHSPVCRVNIFKERILLFDESQPDKQCSLTGHLQTQRETFEGPLLPGRLFWPLEDRCQAPYASWQCRKKSYTKYCSTPKTSVLLKTISIPPLSRPWFSACYCLPPCE